MTQVTRDIDPADARDLLERPARACLAFAGPAGPQAQPVTLTMRDGRYFVAIPESTGVRPEPGQEVVLLVDDGVHYFDLRAIYVRGHAQPAQAPASVRPALAWLEVVPVKTVAWDYGAMRAVDDGH